MKNQLIYVLMFLMSTSCSEWLDVAPESEVKADKLYETETGFKDALIGVYIGMTDRNAYGMNLSWGALEFLAGQYQAPNGEYGQFQKYNYKHKTSKTLIYNIWKKQYNLISEINFLLKSLNKNPRVLNSTTLNIIKGEALALRAMLHFDIMRLFAKGNLKTGSQILDELCIPYVIRHSKIITGQKSYRETLKLLHEDIDKALQLLESDPLYPFPVERPEGYDDMMKNIFFSGDYFKGREIRMSYPAVLLLKSRVALWEGNETLALEYAERLIAAFEKYVENGTHTWATEDYNVSANKTASYKDFVFHRELLFALDVTKLSNYIEIPYSTTKNGNQNYDRLIQPADFIDEIYNAGGHEANSDLRYINWYEDIAELNGKWTIKIKKTDGHLHTNLLPLMRISEAYLIAAECLVDKDRSKSVRYMNFLKEKRNIAPDYYLADNIGNEDLRKAIIREYRKEFGQEGQLFFLYKRLGLPEFPGIQYVKGEMTDVQYVLPYPDIEKDLGQRH